MAAPRTPIPEAKPASAPSAPEMAELRTVLAHLNHELGRRLAAFRDGLETLLRDPAWRAGAGTPDHLRTMSALCDNLLGLARDSLGGADRVHWKLTEPLGGERARSEPCKG
jgi:hypothetical protein